VAVRALVPPKKEDIVVSDLPMHPANAHKLLPWLIKLIVIAPLLMAAALVAPSVRMPVEKLDTDVAVAFAICAVAPIYPLVSMPPESPVCKITSEVPFVLTSLNITVIRFTQEGMLVKSMLVPDVDGTRVPEVIPSTAPELIVTLDDPLIVTAMIFP
tara:strand:- start:1879 stop:2349 length:471 start_codon:yes stop_codon:yes gene_type:complete